jgi:succinate dehydrogenase/fumarate reductase flavoprotein subunit
MKNKTENTSLSEQEANAMLTNKQIHDLSPSWHGTDTSRKSGVANTFLEL